jgi:hypothetical protein
MNDIGGFLLGWGVVIFVAIRLLYWFMGWPW